jgi:cytochrome c oxidase subunit II
MSQRGLLGGLGAAALLLRAGSAAAGFADLNLTQGVTPISHEVYHLHMTILWVCVAIGVVVFGAMFISILRHRKSRGAVAAQFHESTAVEIFWTIIPFVILVAIAVPATRTLIAMENTSDADLTIKVTGYQWRWQYEYLDNGISFFSNLATSQDAIDNKVPKDEHYLLEVDHPLVLPINKKVRFLTTGNDVIHSWWVPDLGWKKDAIPGFINASWARIEKPGTYRGQCAELCGKGHGFMPIVVVAKTEADYEQWVKEQKLAMAQTAAAATKTWSREELMAQGEKIYTTTCAACHQPTGTGLPGAFPPLAAGHPFAASDALTTPLRERGFLDESGKVVMGPLKTHLQIVLHGIPGSAMQAFAGQLNDADLAAVITYERNSFGNTTGDLVQPADVAAAR